MGLARPRRSVDGGPRPPSHEPSGGVLVSVLGVICCEVLELEFAYLLASDRELARITVLEDGRSERLLSSLGAQGLPGVERISTLGEFVPHGHGQPEALVRVLELGLHIWPQKLRTALVQAAEEMAPRVDALVLGYGLCGNALEAPSTLLSHLGVPVFLPMNEDHPVDDCIGLLIGGRERYYAEQCKVAGTFFVTPGWAYHWRRLLDQEMGGVSLEMARRMFQHYARTLLISNPVMSDQEMQESIQEFVDTFGFRIEACQGTISILQTTWQEARDSLHPH
ncbi:MAG TPA: DUF1638 domain-containing protein [Chloroflexi bacterium]|nr:DUF1638 domain-containing protein [Chloroflexota bacterium]